MLGDSTGPGDLAREICTYSTGPDMVVLQGLDDSDAPFWEERARTDLAILATDPESWPGPRVAG